MSGFDKLYQQVVKSSLGQDMLQIREDSPYHREANVLEHTRMCLQWYEDNVARSRTPTQRILTKLALLFHDVGKPMARTEKRSEERGVYFSYPGHELFSANLFEDYALTQWQLFEKEVELVHNELDQVRCLIEHHLPYDKTGKDKLIALKTHMIRLGGEELIQMYYDVLRSDAHGRISDDPDGTYARVEEWITKFALTQPLDQTDADKRFEYVEPYMIVAIGASGSGKSSWFHNHFSCDDADGPSEYLFSLDEHRVGFYVSRQTGKDEDYHDAWNYCHRSEDKEVEKAFDKYCLEAFMVLIKRKGNIFLDISNVSAKARRKWITLARQHSYAIHAVRFHVPFDVCVARQATRNDKSIPKSSIRDQYFRISTPLVGTEVDTLRSVYSYDFSEVK
jgi:predicted kinase